MHIDEKALLQAAWLAVDRAYAPYSHFPVGAALITRAGLLFSGCNVENATYGATVCAERVAIAKAVSEGALRPGDLLAMLVATPTSRPVPPCGICRQIIEEFGDRKETVVLLSVEKSQVARRFLHADLLPHSFNSEDL